MEDGSETGGRAAFWATFLGPVAFGLVAGLGHLVFPWLSAQDPGASAADRFWAPALGGLSVAVILQVGRWWLYGRGQDRQREALRTFCTVTLLVMALAAGVAVLLDPWSLVMLLPLPLFVGFLVWWPRKKAVPPQNIPLGIYCICIVGLILSVATVSMAMTPAT